MLTEESGTSGQTPTPEPVRAIIPERRPSGRDVVNPRLRASAAYFKQIKVKVELQANLHETRAWLQLDHESYVNGALKRKPWLDLSVGSASASVKDPSDIAAHQAWRLDVMKSAAFENGLRKLIDLMLSKPAIKFICDDDVLAEAVAYNGIAFHHQLAAFERVGRGNMTLSEAARRFDYGQPARLRDALLGGMAELGLWKSRPSLADHEAYAISIGPVAWEFQKQVLEPTIAHFSSHPIFK